MTVSRLDQLYRGILVSKFFTKGWGNPENIKKLFKIRQLIKQRDTCSTLVSKEHPIYIDKEEIHSDCEIIDGHFKSPFAEHLPGVVPTASENAYFQMILPKKWKTTSRPICLHLAGTGDHFFWRRRTFMAKPLLKEYGIASIILENPFYGTRKPKDQLRSNLHNVSDIFVMGGCLMLESMALFNWCERQGFGPLGVTGISMGGHMACLAAGVWSKPIVLVPCLSWTSAAGVFTRGVMSTCINWHLLQNQYFTNGVYHDELKNLIPPLVDDGKLMISEPSHFVKSYPSTFEKLNVQSTTSQIKERLNALNFSTQLSLGGLGDGKHESTSNESRISSSWKSNNPKSVNKSVEAEALQFMRNIMDEFTHLANFAKPVDTSLVIVVAAKDDAYVLREGVTDLTQLWQGAELRLLDAGHVAAFIFNQGFFRKAIADGFERLFEKYGSEFSDKRVQKQM